jgi:hypothetical protein
MRGIALSVAVASLFISGCSGLIDSDVPGSRPEAGSPRVENESDDSSDTSIPDVYGARFLGDADQCAAIVCSGSQVCCVIPIPSDAPSEHPNNKCDYNCTAQCMDSCPALSLGNADAAPPSGGNGLLHGGPVVLALDDGGGD